MDYNPEPRKPLWRRGSNAFVDYVFYEIMSVEFPHWIYLEWPA